ncbi:MAG: glutamate mutase L [Anaerolineae bacterium]|nr:glutamate mutase L [Anaerolineae bacterium]
MADLEETALQEIDDLEKSFILADIGTANTTVILIDTVDGSYRLVACASVPTTARLPWLDVMRCVQQAISRLSEITGRTLLNERGTLIRPPRKDGSGVDHFAMVVSAPAPLKTVLVGLYDEMSLASLRKALRTIYVQEVEVVSLADTRSEAEQITAVIQSHPDLIAIAGGTDGGAEERLMRLVEVAAVASMVLTNSQPPHVLYAGNLKVREQVRALLDENSHLHMANNIRPDLATEQLDGVMRLVGDLYEDIKIHNLPGIHELTEWAAFPILSTARAFANVCHYFAGQHQRVLGIDLGSNSTTLIMAETGKVQLSVRTDLGVGEPLSQLLRHTAVDNIARWLPEEVDEADIVNHLYNKSLYPHTIPQTETELHLEQAVARTVLNCALQLTAVEWNWMPPGHALHLPAFDRLLVHGSVFARSPRPGQVMLLLLDALQPTGTFSVGLDQYGVLPPLGVLAGQQPLVVVQTLAAGVLSELGWVIAPAGKGQPGKKVLDIVIESPTARFEGEIEFGKIEVFPIAPGQEAQVTVKPTGRFDIGFGAGQGKTLTLKGGAVGGLVIDARGRPLSLPRDANDRRNLMRKWQWDLGG